MSDSDEDGVPDDIEISGIPIASGEIVYPDPNNKYSDDDGLTDGEEVGTLVRNPATPACTPSEAVEYKFYFNIKSDPTKVDSDGDGLNDDEELSLISGECYSKPLLVDSDSDEIGDFNDPQPMIYNEINDIDYNIWANLDIENYMTKRNITEMIFIGAHKVLNTSNYHTSIIVFVSSESEYYNADHFDQCASNWSDNWNNIHYVTFGAGPKWGLTADPLTANFNREKDIQLNIKEHMINLTTKSNINEKLSDLIQSHNNYIQSESKPDYILFPDNEDEHNSNSYASGLLIAASIDDLGGPECNVPGYEYPVPSYYFGG